MLIWIFLTLTASVGFISVALNIKWKIEDREMESKAKEWLEKAEKSKPKNRHPHIKTPKEDFLQPSLLEKTHSYSPTALQPWMEARDIEYKGLS